jgi:mRNA interferase RelE/StbE
VDNYRVEMLPSVRKELLALPNDVLERTVTRIESLAENPRPPGCKKLKGFRNQWRIRIGDWRVVYIIDDSKALVSIARIAHRKDVYDS